MPFGPFGGAEMGMLIPIITVIMVFTIPIVSIIMEGVEKRARMKVLEEALKQGVPMENLPLSEAGHRLPYRSGMVCLAVGAGIMIFGFSISLVMRYVGEPDFMIPRFVFMGIGSIVALIGAALLINDHMHRDRLYRQLEKSDDRRNG